MKVYNVWVCVEAIDEHNSDEGEDVASIKLAKFKKLNDAIHFANHVEQETDTQRDKNGFTI